MTRVHFCDSGRSSGVPLVFVFLTCPFSSPTVPFWDLRSVERKALRLEAFSLDPVILDS